MGKEGIGLIATTHPFRILVLGFVELLIVTSFMIFPHPRRTKFGLLGRQLMMT